MRNLDGKQLNSNQEAIVINSLRSMAKDIRRDVLEMISFAGSGHPGGSLSAVDILLCLYFFIMKHDPKNPNWSYRDRFILSKGHAAPALYAVLSRAGYFPREEIFSLRKLGSILQGHPESRLCPGVDATTGPLGQGLSFANGIALSAKLDKKDYKTYVLLGDGELQEGQVWEAAMTSAHYELNNIIAIIDCNGMQIDGRIYDIKNIYPIYDKFKAFGWNVIIIDGHSYPLIINVLNQINNYNPCDDIRNMYLIDHNRPTVVIAGTIKGKGVRRMENTLLWHGKAPNEKELEDFLNELK